MIVSDLIKRLEKCNPDSVVILVGYDGGWCNIERLNEQLCTVELHMADHPENYKDKD